MTHDSRSSAGEMKVDEQNLEEEKIGLLKKGGLGGGGGEGGIFLT